MDFVLNGLGDFGGLAFSGTAGTANHLNHLPATIKCILVPLVFGTRVSLPTTISSGWPRWHSRRSFTSDRDYLALVWPIGRELCDRREHPLANQRCRDRGLTTSHVTFRESSSISCHAVSSKLLPATISFGCLLFRAVRRRLGREKQDDHAVLRRSPMSCSDSRGSS